MRAFRRHPGKETLKIDHEALMGAARDNFAVVGPLGLEADPPSLDRDDAGGNADAHAERRGLEMLDREPGANARLARFELRRNGSDRRGLEPVAEDRGG